MDSASPQNDCGTEGSTAQCLSGWECDANHDCVLSCSDIGESCSSDSDCCSGVPCDDQIENGGNKCGCPTNYVWGPTLNGGLGDCDYQPATCDEGPSYICDFAPYLDPVNCISGFGGCCIASSYGGEDYYEFEPIEVLTV